MIDATIHHHWGKERWKHIETWGFYILEFIEIPRLLLGDGLDVVLVDARPVTTVVLPCLEGDAPLSGTAPVNWVVGVRIPAFRLQDVCDDVVNRRHRWCHRVSGQRGQCRPLPVR